MDPLYASHVPLTSAQKLAVGVLSGLGAAMNPRRADLIAAFGELTGIQALQSIRQRMQSNTEGARILYERPRVSSESVSIVYDMPQGTFGRAYGDFMAAREFNPDDRPLVRFVDDPELAYVAQRYREVHDLWHVLFQCHTNLSGESALKAVEFLQTGLPMTGLAVLAGRNRMNVKQRENLDRTYLPWAVKAGSQCADLMCIYYELYWEEKLAELQNRWRIEAAPAGISSKKG